MGKNDLWQQTAQTVAKVLSLLLIYSYLGTDAYSMVAVLAYVSAIFLESGAGRKEGNH